MQRFDRLTVEEARTLSRDELLPRIEEEQKYWYHRIHHCQMKPDDDAAFRTFNQIMHAAINPGRSLSETLAVFEEEPPDPDYWTKPLGERGEL
jgi:hypothetical protein